MRNKKGGYWVVLVLLVGLMSAAVTTGTADEPRAEPSSIACGDVANCTLMGPALAVTNGGAGAAIRGRSTSARIGVLGIGQPGVRGTSGNGVGVEAHSTMSHGLKATSENGVGVWASGRPAVKGTSEDGSGVEGHSTNGLGLKGWSENFTGVWGSGQNSGVYGQSGAATGMGVYGLASATAGQAIGVRGESASASGFGVFGWAGSTTGSTYGLYGRSDSTDGIGAFGYVTAQSGPTYGVRGESDSLSGRGVFGYATNPAGSTYGVFGRSDSLSGRGVYGFAAVPAGVNYGVFGRADSPIGYGVYSDGNFAATGSKSAIVPTEDHGWRHLYAVESTEVLFEDVGTVQLENGQAEVVIEPIFAETVNLEEPYQVFLTPLCGEPVLLFVSAQGNSSFTVEGVTLSGQPSACSFHYRIIAKRLGYEDIRLAPAEDPDAVLEAEGPMQ